MSSPERNDLERVVLTSRFHLWQRRAGHRSATDDVLCAWAALTAAPGGRRVLDLGAGQGSVTLMLAGTLPHAEITAIEVQEVSARLLECNIAENGLSGRVRVCHDDLRRAPFERAVFDLVSGSPPFLPSGSGLPARDGQRTAARFELHGGIEDYCLAAARALAKDGVASFLMDGAQDVRSRAAIARAALHLRDRIEVLPRAGARPRFLIYRMQRLPPSAAPSTQRFAVRDESGHYTPELRAIRARLDLPSPERDA